ncbi:MAG: hypothetical protein ACTS73_00820 [Arsenophonus sp. NEOnobi-MAG3]
MLYRVMSGKMIIFLLLLLLASLSMDVMELVAVEDDYQELEANLAELLNALRARALTIFLRLATEKEELL